MSEEPYVRAIARTMARSKYPLAWFENYPTNIFTTIKEYVRETIRKSTMNLRNLFRRKPEPKPDPLSISIWELMRERYEQQHDELEKDLEAMK